MRGLPTQPLAGAGRWRPGCRPRGNQPATRNDRRRPRERWPPPAGRDGARSSRRCRGSAHLRRRHRAAWIPPAPFQCQTEQVGGIEAVHGGPAVGTVADIAGDARGAGDVDHGGEETVISCRRALSEGVAQPTSARRGRPGRSRSPPSPSELTPPQWPAPDRDPARRLRSPRARGPARVSRTR